MKNAKNRTEVRGGVNYMAVSERYFYKHPSSIWEQIKEDILALIICGKIAPGDKAPSIAEVTEKCNCSKTTAQKALESLCEEEILYLIPGRGFFVNSTKDIKNKIEDEYKESMEKTLQRFITMGKQIKMSDDEILKQVEKYLHAKN